MTNFAQRSHPTASNHRRSLRREVKTFVALSAVMQENDNETQKRRYPLASTLNVILALCLTAQ